MFPYCVVAVNGSSRAKTYGGQRKQDRNRFDGNSLSDV